jgi:hypothetical protein
VVVVEGGGQGKPIGVARAADILRLRRWVIEEEGYQPRADRGEDPAAATVETLPQTHERL